jgi:hypothetical protein
MSSVSSISQPSIVYDRRHLLGVPQEIRDQILDLLEPDQANILGGRPVAGYASYKSACRQTFHETSKRWASLPSVLVPARLTDEYLKHSFNAALLHSNSHCNVKRLVLEIQHDAPGERFTQMAQILKFSTQLEELFLFGIGSDRFSVPTGSLGRGCGKYDGSITQNKTRLHLDGQDYQRRLPLVNNLMWLGNLRVLVLENLNMPLFRAHVLKNKPRLRKLYIGADPRSVIHGEYRKHPGLGLGSVLYPVQEKPPPVKELHVQSNAIFTASGVVAKVGRTLESLSLVVPDGYYQTEVSLLREATHLFVNLPLNATRLRELRICVGGPMCEDHVDFGGFMGALESAIARMTTLQLVEIHMHNNSSWFDVEFIESLPASVTRLYLSDLFYQGMVHSLCNTIAHITSTTPQPAVNFDQATTIGESKHRQDFIPFPSSKLGFVGYEYDLYTNPTMSERQDDEMTKFIRLNAKLLDKERNRHLARFEGRCIPPKRGPIPVEDDTDVPLPPDFEVDAILAEEARREFAQCELGRGHNQHAYFGNETAAETIFRHEPVANARKFSYPVIVEIDNQFRFGNHWLSQ